ncbi:MAG TPA: hypothetical protein VFT98_19135, partial [Myxococcota bacterium]|nr:hypothetical protein [Myxococcota bacterium]
MGSDARFLIAAACAFLALGCGARYVRVPLVETPELTVTLRSQTKGGAALPRGFAHPAALSAARAENALARIEIRETTRGDETRRPAIPPELARPIGRALADALGRADATQEVVVRARRRERRLGVFSRSFATSFVAFVDAQQRLQVHLVDADRELPPGDDAPLPEPVAGRGPHAIKALPGAHIETLGQRGVAIDYRAELFQQAPSRAGAGRRTILMETAQPDALKASGAAPASADPERLRALADLEAAR